MPNSPAQHKLVAVPPPVTPCPKIITGSALKGYEQYCTDESRQRGTAEALVSPSNTAELAAAVAEAQKRSWPVTASGARTGITAGAVPESGLVVSLERMNRVLALKKMEDGSFAVRCGAGMVLDELRRVLRVGAETDISLPAADKKALKELRGQHYFFPPDPTETTATIGGIVACNASGAHTFRYGPARPYIQGMTVVLADGSLLKMQRGHAVANAQNEFLLQKIDGSEMRVRLPGYRQPLTKNAAGYYSETNMDLVDLFIGSEGTLGVICEVEIKLIPAPETSSAAVLFFAAEDAAIRFIHEIRGQKSGLGLEAIEYFGPNALGFLRKSRRHNGAASGVPACLPDAAANAVYVDIGCAKKRLQNILSEIAKIAAASGADPEACWSAQSRDERERLRLFRHALPEAVNTRIAELQRGCAQITKLGTDMAVPDDCLPAVIAMYRHELEQAGLEYVIFGHIGDNHLHVNILPHTLREYEKGKALYLQFAKEVVNMGGSPAAEHGIGKLKREFLELLVGKQGIDDMRKVKKALDPKNRLGRGTLFS